MGNDRSVVLRKAEVRNAVLLGAQGMVAAFGGPLLPVGLLAPILVRLGGTDILIGLLSALGNGVAIPGMVLGAHVGMRTRRRRAAAVGWNLAYLSVFLPAVLLLLLRGPAASLNLFVAAAALAAVTGGMFGSVGGVIQVDLLSRVTLESRRGRVTGMIGFVSGLGGLAGGVFLTAALGWFAFPRNYAWVAVLGLLLCAGGAFLFLGMRELPGSGAGPGVRMPGVGEAIRRIRGDRAFLGVLLGAMLKFGFNSAMVFVVPTALRRHGLGDAFVGHYAILASATGLVVSPIQGWSADRLGIGVTACAGGAISAAGMALFARAGSAASVLAASGMLLIGSLGIGGMYYLAPMSMSPPEHRSSYIAARYMAEGLAGLVCTPVAGWTIATFDPAWTFYAGGAAAIASGALLWLVMKTGRAAGAVRG